MALRRTPHTATIQAVTTSGDGPAAANPHETGTAYSFACQITPMSAEVAYKRTGAELKRPHLVMCNLDAINGGSFTVLPDQLVTYNSVEYRVVESPEEFRGGTATDHMSFVIDRFDN
jgi:hypothetical protein